MPATATLSRKFLSFCIQTTRRFPVSLRKTYKGIIPTIPLEIQSTGADKAVLETLPAYYTYLTSGGFSKYTPDDFTGDVKKFGVYLKDKIIQDIRERDIRACYALCLADDTLEA